MYSGSIVATRYLASERCAPVFNRTTINWRAMRRPEDGEEAVTAGQDSHRLKQRATRSTGRCRYLKLKSGGGAALRVTGSVRGASMSDTACVADSAAPLICREDDSQRSGGIGGGGKRAYGTKVCRKL